jgi:hypothetical protein
VRPILFSLAFSILACGGAATPANSPEAPPPDAPPSTAPDTPADGPGAGGPKATIPPPPAECAAFAERKSAGTVACTTPDATRTALDAALSESDPAKRDAKLVALEACASAPAGLVRALRAELAPEACGDAIVDPYLTSAPKEVRLDVKQTLAGLSIGARLNRLVRDPPKLEPPFDKARFTEFFKSALVPWITDQARAIQELAAQGAKLGGYGKGVAAVEAGMADMRFVETVREVPLPEELARDEELKNVYYGSLDQALDPRKDRGRDAALVGLRELAAEGIVRDARIERARTLLSKLYAGRRIDALDGLLLEPLAPADTSTVERRLARALPSFYTGLILADRDPSDAALLRALLDRGLPRPMRAGLDAAKLTPQARELYGRVLVELGQRYWRSEDFERAARVLERGAGGKSSEGARLVRGLATALKGGPRDAAEMMLKGPFLPAGVGNVAELDGVAKGGGAVAGMAAYDAAFILQLVPPRDADKRFWRDVATRYRRAAKLLTDAEQRRRAEERAKGADEIAAAIR